YVRFGGEYTETCLSDFVRRGVLSLQMARTMNSGGAVYPDEVHDICTKQDETNRLFGEILEQLSRLK
ncbi:hypothetical protein AALC17_19080, partial [Oscillospiraceae bacterium 38-13]